MVPSGWICSQIGDIANIQVGRDLVEDRYSDNQTEQYKYPVYSNTIENRGLYGFYDFPEYPGNAVTVVGRGIGLGTAFARYENEAFGAIGRLLVLTPKNNYFDVGYFADYINFLLRIHNESGGIPQLPGSSLSKYSVILPPLSEQKKNAQILSTWDQAISTTEQLLANSQQQKKALMQQLLTSKKRLRDKNGVRFSGEWSRSGLGNVFDKISNGVTYDAKNMDGLPVTRIETISTGKINYEKVGWAPDEDNTRRFKLKKGDILYSHINSLEHIGRVAYFNGSKELYHGMNLLLLRAKNNYDSLFLFYVLNSQIGKKYAKTFAKSAVNQASISTADIKAFKVHIPCFDEQQKIGLVLSVADQDIETLQRKLDCLKQEKKALMQQLLTGKRRVNIEQKELHN